MPKVNINCYVIIFYMFIKFLQYHLELTGEWQQNMEWCVSVCSCSFPPHIPSKFEVLFLFLDCFLLYVVLT